MRTYEDHKESLHENHDSQWFYILCGFTFKFLRIELKSRFARTKFCESLRGIGTGSRISNALSCQ